LDVVVFRFSVIFPGVQQAVKKREQCLQVRLLTFIVYSNVLAMLPFVLTFYT